MKAGNAPRNENGRKVRRSARGTPVPAKGRDDGDKRAGMSKGQGPAEPGLQHPGRPADGMEERDEMFTIYRKEVMWAGRKLTFETGRIARQADGAVLATYGETAVLATVVAAREPKPGVDFFPLTVNYQEKAFAAGKIPGGFFKREGRPNEKETLTSRLIDRPIRPMFTRQ